jgi:hypothetical protein
MSYQTSKGKYVDARDIKLDPLENPLTIDGYSPVVEVGKRRVLSLILVASAVSASDTVDVAIQSSNDGTNWFTEHAFTQVIAPVTQRKTVTVGRYVRAFYDVGGSAISIACTLRAEAV